MVVNESTGCLISAGNPEVRVELRILAGVCQTAVLIRTLVRAVPAGSRYTISYCIIQLASFRVVSLLNSRLTQLYHIVL